MLHITVNVTGAKITALTNTPLVTGTVGATASFSFDKAWDGLTKTAVFRAGRLTRDVVDISDTVTVPWEVLRNKYDSLFVGVYGCDRDGTIVFPTLWAKVGTIQSGADPSGDESTDPSPVVWEQMLQAVKNAEEIAQSVRDDADNGEFDGKPGQKGDPGDYIVCNATGNAIILVDASERPLQSIKFPNNPFTGTAKFAVYGGKNLLNIEAMLNDCLTKAGSAYRMKRLADGYMSAKQELFLSAGTYVFSVNDQYAINSIDGTGYLYFSAEYEDGTTLTGRILQEGWTSNKVTFAKNVVGMRLFIPHEENVNSNVVFRDLQLEYGGNRTAYEPFVGQQIVDLAVTNGQVDNPELLHIYKPSNTIMNGAGAYMAVKYVADTKTYIDNKFTELQNAIVTTGANV